jgi:transcriptional regulator with XRE-family HTH domain
MGYAPRDEEQFEPFDGLATDGSALPFDAWLTGELDAREMTPGRLSRLSGLHRSTISRLLHGERHPTVETATRIAVALGSTRLPAGRERRTDIVARVRHELAADPTLSPRDVQRVMARYVLQRGARRRRATVQRLGCDLTLFIGPGRSL